MDVIRIRMCPRVYYQMCTRSDDDDLMHCRQRTALVCRRWWQLLRSSPQLLHTVDACFGGDLQTNRLRSFCKWALEHAAGRVERLNLQLLPNIVGSWNEQLAAAACVAAIVTGCSMAGELRELRLAGEICHPDFWAGKLHSLRRLAIGSRMGVMQWVVWDPRSHVLPRLEELWLDGSTVQLAPSAVLPTTLTNLRISTHECDSLPFQARRCGLASRTPPQCPCIRCTL